MAISWTNDPLLRYLVLIPLLDALITRIAESDPLIAMQKRMRLGDIGVLASVVTTVCVKPELASTPIALVAVRELKNKWLSHHAPPRRI